MSAGTKTVLMLLSLRRFNTSSVIRPLNTLNITRAAWSGLLNLFRSSWHKVILSPQLIWSTQLCYCSVSYLRSEKTPVEIWIETSFGPFSPCRLTAYPTIYHPTLWWRLPWLLFCRKILLFALALNFFWPELLWILAHIWKGFGQNLELGILEHYVSQLFQRFDGKKQVRLRVPGDSSNLAVVAFLLE